ncbi:putative exocyst complex component Exo70, cullin repeat-like-containing domain-containing protein [Rosa chinensis]|uniref:Exocyst subunit Exo70 family protein n=1 Tax=Rosa chinensis TaxID=74649 RepID=A0A2P6RZT2_ROSCH|nr:exocyst complex component EXO70A1 [Rosa chinensis]PRQ51937.1 putative exocyst complex component Exo70, cullin repeat-like-containing domain-containing protein [Rosa chinensis]
MADVESVENLRAAQKILRASLEKSTAISSKLDEIGPRLEDIRQRLPSLEAAIRPSSMQKCSYFGIRDQINAAIGPAAAVLKVYDVVRELEESLLYESCDDLSAYLSSMKMLEEALGFLADNCGLAIQWLEDIVEFLEDNVFSNDQSLLNVKKSLRILQELHEIEERAHLDGGALNAAFNNLETEFRSLLMENSVTTTTCATLLPLTMPVVQKLQAISGRLDGDYRLEKCIVLYIEVRSLNAVRSLQALNLDYLEIQVTEFDDIQSIESHIDQWCKHLELVVKDLIELEYKLCNDVFEKIGSDAWKHCVARLAEEFRLISFLQFGRNVTKMKKNPLKLLKLLDMFALMESLRSNFNRLFGGEACTDIRTLTRELVKTVVNSAFEIFQELPCQVEMQRRFSPPPDGGIPGLVSFITNYCDQLLGDDYRPLLAQVLKIHQSWNQDVYGDGFLTNHIIIIMKEVALNLDAWSKAYEDICLSYLFMMNNHCHFCQLKGTRLGDIMGDSWLGAHEQYKDNCAALYLRQCWGKLLPLISQKDLNSFQESEKKTLKEFNEGFDELYKEQSNWIICDENLRRKVCQILVQAVVPAYRSYMQKYGVLVDQDASASKYVKHTAQSLETMLSSMFQPTLVKKYCSTKHIRFGKLRNLVQNQFRVTLTAM